MTATTSSPTGAGSAVPRAGGKPRRRGPRRPGSALVSRAKPLGT
jgi:hypothetical protein